MRRRPGGPYRIDLQNPVADHPLNVGLVSWWLPLPHLFGGGRLWDLCNRSHGTLVSSPSWAPGGVIDYSSGGYISIANSASLGLTGDLTVIARIRTSTANEDEIYNSYEAGGGFSGFSLGIGVVVGAGLITFYSSGGGSWVGSNSTVNDGNWRTVAASLAGSTVSFYRDGLSDGSQATGAPGSYTGSKAIAARNDGANQFTGAVHWVRLYNRALSASENHALHTDALAGHPDTLRRYPERSWFVLRESEAAAGGLSVVIASHHYRQMAAAG